MGVLDSYRKSDAQIQALRSLVRAHGSRIERVSAEPPHHARQLRDDEVSMAAARYKAGASILELAREFRIHRTTMSERLRDAGVGVRHNDMTPELVTRAAKLYESGLSLAAVGTELGFSASTILTHLRRAHAHIRPRQGGVRNPHPVGPPSDLTREVDIS